MTTRIENWSMHKKFKPYQAPELATWRLCGTVTGHYSLPDGSKVTTSEVVEMNVGEHRAVTKNGTHYVLGRPSSDWRKWCAKEGYKLADYNRTKA